MRSTPDQDELQGTPLILAGRYRIVRTLESMDTGATFLAYDVRLRAWRTLAVPWPGQRTAQKRLVAQAEKLARLEHPAVERVVDLGADGAVTFVVRDRLHGSLAEHVESRGALTPALAASTVARIADGLVHAHSRGLVHGQIRPRLVRFADDAGVVLTGFGELRVVDATTAGRVAEPWAHLAPEQRVEWNPDEAGDVYSLGALLYTLVAGKYNGDLFRIAPGDPVLSSLHAELHTIVLTACARDPRARYGSVEVLGNALASRMHGLGTLEHPLPWHLDIESLPSSSGDRVPPDAGVRELLRVVGRHGAAAARERTAVKPEPATKTPIPYAMSRLPDDAPAFAERRAMVTLPPDSTDPMANVKVFGLNTGKKPPPPPPPPKRDYYTWMLAGSVAALVAAVVGGIVVAVWLGTAESRADSALTEAIEFERVTAERLAMYAKDRRQVEQAWFAFNDASVDEKVAAAAAFARVAIGVRDDAGNPLPPDTADAIDRMAEALEEWERTAKD